MLSVSPPAEVTSFEERYSIYMGAGIAEIAEQDPVLESGWDLALPRGQAESSQSPSGSTSASASSSSSHASLGLLIRSKYQGWERSFELHHDWPIPEIKHADEVLVRNVSVGLNPVDFKSILYNFGISGTPWILGRDIAGVVEQVGTDVTDLRIGQRVWVCADSRDIRSGAYQAYSTARRAHLGKIDADTSTEQAASLGTGVITTAIVAYWFFKWNRALCLDGSKTMPRSSHMDYEADTVVHKDNWILIYGGATNTGVYLAQIARLSGLRVISIASPANFEYLTSLGVTHCINRFLEPEEIQEQVLLKVGKQGVSYCVDAVGSKTATLCWSILRSAGQEEGQMICLAGDPKSISVNANLDRPAKMRRNAAGTRIAVDAVDDLKRGVKMHKISFSTTFYGDDLFAKGVMDDLDMLIHRKELIPAKCHIWLDGLAGVRGGLEALRDNCAPRGKKLVVNLADTPHAHLTNLGIRSELGWNGAV